MNTGVVFAAHPWLSGPWETYLGYTERGGALAEHSHALNLWQYLAEFWVQVELFRCKQ